MVNGPSVLMWEKVKRGREKEYNRGSIEMTEKTQQPEHTWKWKQTMPWTLNTHRKQSSGKGTSKNKIVNIQHKTHRAHTYTTYYINTDKTNKIVVNILYTYLSLLHFGSAFYFFFFGRLKYRIGGVVAFSVVDVVVLSLFLTLLLVAVLFDDNSNYSHIFCVQCQFSIDL